MDRFAALSAFTKVVEAGGFAAAARELALSRSQVNKLVINLEEHLGVQLLYRTTRIVSATPAGTAFYERARAVLADLTEAEQAIQSEQDEPSGELKVNAPMSFGTLHLGSALSDFMLRYPKIRIQLVLSDRFVDPIAEGFDLTVRISEPAPTPSLIDHEIVEIKRVICASPDYLKANRPPTKVEELAVLPCLHYGNLATGNLWRLTGPDGVRDVRVNGVLCSNNAEVLKDGALRGLGFALLPTFIAGADLQEGRLVTVLNEFHAPSLKLCLLYTPNRHLSARIRLLVAFFYERFGDRPHWDLVN